MHTIFKMTLVLRRTILCWNRTSRPMSPPPHLVATHKQNICQWFHWNSALSPKALFGNKSSELSSRPSDAMQFYQTRSAAVYKNIEIQSYRITKQNCLYKNTKILIWSWVKDQAMRCSATKLSGDIQCNANKPSGHMDSWDMASSAFVEKHKKQFNAMWLKQVTLRNIISWYGAIVGWWKWQMTQSVEQSNSQADNQGQSLR